VKPFRFRAERVLEWRAIAANSARGAFMRASESVREAADDVSRAEARCGDGERALRADLDAPIDAEMLLRHRNWIDQQRAATAACQRLHDERVEAAAAAAITLRDAMRHVKVLERLRERARQRHVVAERREEGQRLDELAVQRFVRAGTER